MPGVEFTTALARLLVDGALRDDLAGRRERALDELRVEGADRAALAALDPEDLEFQALVLLRKRFQAVQHWLPETCRRLDGDAWRLFHEFARSARAEHSLHEATRFIDHLERRKKGTANSGELNRLRFLSGRSQVAIHCLRDHAGLIRPKWAMQVLMRRRGGKWLEWVFHLKL